LGLGDADYEPVQHDPAGPAGHDRHLQRFGQFLAASNGARTQVDDVAGAEQLQDGEDLHGALHDRADPNSHRGHLQVLSRLVPRGGGHACPAAQGHGPPDHEQHAGPGMTSTTKATTENASRRSRGITQLSYQVPPCRRPGTTAGVGRRP
jgi:hypothetical protein